MYMDMKSKTVKKRRERLGSKHTYVIVNNDGIDEKHVVLPDYKEIKASEWYFVLWHSRKGKRRNLK